MWCSTRLLLNELVIVHYISSTMPVKNSTNKTICVLFTQLTAAHRVTTHFKILISYCQCSIYYLGMTWKICNSSLISTSKYSTYIQTISTSGFLKSDVSMPVYASVSVCPSPRLLITSGVIWVLYDWLNNFCYLLISNYGPYH